MSGVKRKAEKSPGHSTPDRPTNKQKSDTELHIPNKHGSHGIYVDENDVMTGDIVKIRGSSTQYNFQPFTTDMIGDCSKRLYVLYDVPERKERYWMPLWVIDRTNEDHPQQIGLTTKNYSDYNDNTKIFIYGTQNMIG